MPKNIRKRKINFKDTTYLNRDFESFRNELIRYARVHYGDTILDFSEASLAGMFVDMAAYVGDIMSFYQDHQFNELSLETAVEERNIERLIRSAGVEISGASPSYVEVSLKLKVDADTQTDGSTTPTVAALPVIRSGTSIASTSGVEFELLENIDFAEKDDDGELIATVEVASTNSDSVPTEYFLSRIGKFTSAKTVIESFIIPDVFKPFRTITLKNSDVNEIIRVTDTDGDDYYEVDSLTQDTVYIRQKNDLTDYLSVPERIKMIPAPKRFEKFTDRKYY